MTPAPKPLTVLQISDCHLRAESEGELLGMKTQDSLDAVLLRVAQEPSPDLLIMSGDLAQDGSLSAYQNLQRRLAGFKCPVAWFMGNHDNAESMRRAVGSGSELMGDISLAAWRWVFLDSSFPGHVYGQLGVSELTRLEHILESSQDQFVAIALHHHPVAMGSAWLDEIGLQDDAAFHDLIARYPNVKLVLWGHVHQAFDDCQNGVRLLSTPSSCIQFKPGSSQFELDSLAPGYRKLLLHEDGRIETDVIRVDNTNLTVDLSSKGY